MTGNDSERAREDPDKGQAVPTYRRVQVDRNAWPRVSTDLGTAILQPKRPQHKDVTFTSQHGTSIPASHFPKPERSVTVTAQRLPQASHWEPQRSSGPVTWASSKPTAYSTH